MAGLALIWVLGALAYWPALDGPWLYDDVKLQEMLTQVAASGSAVLGDGGWKQHLTIGGQGSGRPLSMASFLVNGLFSQEPFAFKLTNLILHLVNGTLVLLLSRELFRASGTEQRGAAALAAALIWTLHPLQLSTVAYVIQRMTILSALFSLWALLSYVRIRMREIRDGSPARLVSWSLPLVLLPVLAVGAKENGALIPLFLLAAEATLFRLRGPRRTRRLLMLYFGVYLLAAVAALSWALASDFLAMGYEGSAYTLGERLLTQPRVMVRYLGQILLPRLDDMIFFYDGMAHSRGVASPPTTWLATVLLLGFGLLAAFLARRRPLAAFGLLLFLCGHALESSILPLKLAFEHRNYLPGLGIFLTLVDLLFAAGGTLAQYRRSIAVLAVAAAASLTFLRAHAWSEAEHIYATAIHGKPPSVVARAGLAQRLTDRGKTAEARRLLSATDHLGARLQAIYLDCVETGRTEVSGLDAARSSVGDVVGNYGATGLIRLANLALDGDCDIPARALLSLLEAAASAPRVQSTIRQKLLMYSGHLHHARGEPQAAFEALERAYGVYPANPVPLLLAANWRLDSGDLASARDLYRRALSVPAGFRQNLAPLFRELEERLSEAK